MIYKHIVNVEPNARLLSMGRRTRARLSICSDEAYHHLFAMNYECALITEMTKHQANRKLHDDWGVKRIEQ